MAKREKVQINDDPLSLFGGNVSREKVDEDPLSMLGGGDGNTLKYPSITLIEFNYHHHMDMSYLDANIKIRIELTCCCCCLIDLRL